MAWSLYSDRLAGKNIREQKVLVWNDTYRMYVRDADGCGLYVSPLTGVPEWMETALDGPAENTFSLGQMTEYDGSLYVPASDGSLYRSPDGIHWEIQGNTPEIEVLLGALEATAQTRRPATLAAVVREGDTWHFAALADGEWKTGAAVPESFPVTGFGCVSYVQMYYPHLVTVAGKDRADRLSHASWGTMDGLAWVRLTDADTSYFAPREGVALTQYDDRLFLAGGLDASGKALKDAYWSVDKGVSWTPTDSLALLPGDFRARGYASALVDGDQFLLLFGGKESSDANMLEELWRGRINRLGFNE
jgi:hypothetical protein